MPSSTTKAPAEHLNSPMELIPTPQYLLSKAGNPNGENTQQTTPKAKSTVDKPPRDIYVHAATMMCQVHNAFLRAFNTVYHVAPRVPESELTNFLQYARQIYLTLHQHHTEEEEFVFPMLGEILGDKEVWNVCVEEHQIFHAGLDAFNDYVTACLTPAKSETATKFSGTHFQSLIEAFASPLRTHLVNEVTLIAGLGSRFDSPEIRKKFEQGLEDAHKKALGGYTLTESVPLLMLNHDREFEGGLHDEYWPEMPAVMNFLIRRVFTVWHLGWWKYASCNGSQLARPLAHQAK